MFREAPLTKPRRQCTTWAQLPDSLRDRFSKEAESFSGGAVFVAPSTQPRPSNGLGALVFAALALYLTVGLHFEVRKLDSFGYMFRSVDLSPIGFIASCVLTLFVGRDAVVKLSKWKRRRRAAIPFVGTMVYPLDLIVFGHEGLVTFYDTTGATPGASVNMVTITTRTRSGRARRTRTERRGSRLSFRHPELESGWCPTVTLPDDGNTQDLTERLMRARADAERQPDDTDLNPLVGLRLTSPKSELAAPRISNPQLALIGVIAGVGLTYMTVTWG